MPNTDTVQTSAQTTQQGDSAQQCITISFKIDPDSLSRYTDEYIAQLWHISQANPAPFGDRDACNFAEKVARECVRRFVTSIQPELWVHQGRHVASLQKGGAQ